MFHPERPYRCAPGVALRPECFGALAYDFRTRRLSFLKSPELVRVVTALGDHPDVHAALDAAQVAPGRRESCLRALAALAASGVVEARGERMSERAA